MTNSAPNEPRKPWHKRHRMLLTDGVVLALMIFGATDCGGGTQTGTAPATSSVATTMASSEDAFLAELAKWSKRDGWQMGDTGQLIAAGHKVCALMNAGEGNIVASHDVMQQFNFSGQVAQAVGVAAWDNFCPDAEKRS